MVENNTINLLEAGINSPVAWNKMGQRMVESFLFEARAHFSKPTSSTMEKIAFLSGTGMKVIFETFHLPYDYIRFTEAFYNYFNINT